MINSIQGKDVIISLKKDDYVPFVCASDFSCEIDATTVETRTVGDGRWKKLAYQSASYQITLGGVLVWDTDSFTSWDVLGNQLQMLEIPFRASFTHLDGTIKSLQGTLLISKTTFAFTVGDIVKSSHTFDGNGILQQFDGLIPCDTAVTAIAVAGQTAADGTITITYSYTGPVYQVKYRIDAQGDYAYAAIGVAIVIPGLANGQHSVEIIPVCTNAFEGTGKDQAFQVTQAQTCGTVITNIVISSSGPLTATNAFTGSATQMVYSIDGGTEITAPINQTIPLSGLSVGAHSITETPICANNVRGTGFTKAFTVAAQPSQSIINWSFGQIAIRDFTPSFRIFVNGVLTVSQTGSSSGMIVVPLGQSVMAQVSGNRSGRPGAAIVATLLVIDTTTSTQLTNQSQTAQSVSLTFTWTPSGDTYSITETTD